MQAIKNNYQKILSVLLILLLCACREETIQPQLFGSMVGTVIRNTDNVAVENAVISTTPPTSLLLTDDFGRFALSDIEPGTYTVRAEKEGFVSTVESVTVFAQKTANVTVKLQSDSLANIPPTTPNNPTPADGSLDQPVNLKLGWQSKDSDRNDNLVYDVILCKGNQTNCETVLSNGTDNFLELKSLAHSTTYFWQVIAEDGIASVYSTIWSFRTIDFPQHRFVYTKKINNKYDIFSADGNGEEVQLTFNAGSNWRPRISPDRSQIAFISNVNIEPHIFLMNRDGSNLRQLTREVPINGFNNYELDFAWSPDGTRILYMNNAMLYTINLDGRGLKAIAEAPLGFTFSEVDWTSQGNQIVARVTGTTLYESDIFILNENGDYLRQIFTDIPGGTGGLQFSIDGKYVLYTHDISGFETASGRMLNTHIFIKNLENNVTTDLSNLSFPEKESGTNDLDPRFSPDGSKVIFVNTNNDGISPKHIYTMELNGEHREILFENAQMPDWK